MNFENNITKKYLKFLESPELLLRLNWQQWLAVTPPFQETDFSIDEATARFSRNGYEWDMHGSVYIPKKEADPKRAFVIFHGGAGSEKIMDVASSLDNILRLIARFTGNA